MDHSDGAPATTRRPLVVAYGIVCHALFALAVAAMVSGLYAGMQLGRGRIPSPLAWLANVALLVQFTTLHSALLTRRGQRTLARMVPSFGRELSTTTYALVSSVALLALFVLWTPSRIVWWHAVGAARVALTCLYAAAWLLVVRALVDAGLALQTGALGWRAVAASRRPVYPAMPRRGLFALVRQPIYLAFTLTLWTTPTWTPDQLLVASTLTLYCVLAPRWKEARFGRLYGDEFQRYRLRVPYFVPRWRRR
jgi:protein-S-isoprenylcysteine O-methyltransferase Ste14